MISRRLIMIFDEDFEFSGLVAVSRHISEIGDERRQNRVFSEGQLFAQIRHFLKKNRRKPMKIMRYGTFPPGKNTSSRGESSRGLKNIPFPSKNVDF